MISSSCTVLLWGCLGDCFDLRARFRLVRVDAGPVCQSSLLVALSLLLAALPLKLLAALPLLLLAALLLLLPAWLAPLPLAWPAALPLTLLLARLPTSRLALLLAEAAASGSARAPA